MEAESLTSAMAVRQVPPLCLIRSAVWLRVASVRPATMRVAPRAANARAVALPIPDPAPVTKTILGAVMAVCLSEAFFSLVTLNKGPCRGQRAMEALLSLGQALLKCSVQLPVFSGGFSLVATALGRTT